MTIIIIKIRIIQNSDENNDDNNNNKNYGIPEYKVMLSSDERTSITQMNMGMDTVCSNN